ncbi:hypothetical protein PoB_004487900, partial [Plakobranchus ocellatus]
GGHIKRYCWADPHCINCGVDHTASRKTYSKFLEEQANLCCEAENSGTFLQARKATVVDIHKKSFQPEHSQISIENGPVAPPKDMAEMPLLPQKDSLALSSQRVETRTVKRRT